MTKERPIKDFSWPATVMLHDDYMALKSCIDRNRHEFETKEIVIFGAGIRGSVFAVLLRKLGFNNLNFSDNNSEKWGGRIHGSSIIAPDELKDRIDASIVLISVENGEGILNQLSELGFVKDKSVFFPQTRIYENYLSEMTKPSGATTLVIGDCGLSQISIQDENTDNLAEMIRERFGRDSTKVLAMHGMGMRAYYNIVKSQLMATPSLEKLVLMVNFEVFTGKHHLLPRTQHAALIDRISKEPTLRHDEIVEYARIAEERRQGLKLDVASKAQQSTNNSRLIFMMNYMYQLRQDTEDMTFLLKLFELVTEHGIKLFPYIPPANYVYAEKIVGPSFTKKYDRNRETMIGLIEAREIRTLDLSYLLTPNFFASPETIDESANHAGREKILKQITQFVLS